LTIAYPTFTLTPTTKKGKKMDTMTSYEITFQTPNYTLHTQGVGADEDEAVADAIKNLKDEDGIDVSKAWVLEVE
jgi:hypothetical protein